MSRYSLQEFVQQTAQQDLHQGTFELESDRMLEVNLDGMVWMKMGAMISYRGRIKFTREGVFEHGLGNLLKKAVSGEGTKLTKAEGNGKMYLADRGKKISIIPLNGEALCVNGNDILSFASTVKNEIKLMRRVAGMMAGGDAACLVHRREQGGHGRASLCGVAIAILAGSAVAQAGRRHPCNGTYYLPVGRGRSCRCRAVGCRLFGVV